LTTGRQDEPVPPGPPVAPPQQFTGFLLRRAFVLSRGHAEACIGEDASLRDVPALTLLGNVGAMSQHRLGDLLNLNRTTTGKLVDALETKGWVVRERDPHDRRSYALQLTAAGKGAVADMHRALDRGEAALTRPLSPAERRRLSGALRSLLSGDATLAIAGLGDRCGYLIARAHQMLYRRAVQALAPLGLSPRDFGILTALGAVQPCSQQRLAQILGKSAPAVLAFIDEVETAGLVSRHRNATDRRAYDLRLTPLGESKLQAAQRAAFELQALIAHTLGASGDEDLRRLLVKVVGPDAAPAPVGESRVGPAGTSEEKVPPRPVDVAAS
jgi:DNA-binding MarR family transcriptional regulator